LRNTTYVKPADAPGRMDQWMPCKAIYALASRAPRDLCSMDTPRSEPSTCRMYSRKPDPKTDKRRNLDTFTAHTSAGKKRMRRAVLQARRLKGRSVLRSAKERRKSKRAHRGAPATFFSAVSACSHTLLAVASGPLCYSFMNSSLFFGLPDSRCLPSR
jgi:hypothetical protein